MYIIAWYAYCHYMCIYIYNYSACVHGFAGWARCASTVFALSLKASLNAAIKVRVRCYKSTPNLPTNIVDFKGFDSSIIWILRGGIPRPIGDFPESLGQAMLVGIMSVGRLGVARVSGSRGRVRCGGVGSGSGKLGRGVWGDAREIPCTGRSLIRGNPW